LVAFETSFENRNGQKTKWRLLAFNDNNGTTIRTEFKIKNWLKDGFATLNVASTFSQKCSGFERSKGYNLVNLGFGGTKTGQNCI
jgi:iron complex outermembrane receptor protein